MTDEKKPNPKLAMTLGMLAALIPPDPRAGRERERIEQDLANAERLLIDTGVEQTTFPSNTKGWTRRARQLEELRARILELRRKLE